MFAWTCLLIVCRILAQHNYFFSQADKGTIQLHISALIFANLDYILKSTFKIHDGRIILSKFKTLVKVLPVTGKSY